MKRLKSLRRVAVVAAMGLLIAMPNGVFAQNETINPEVTRQKVLDNGGSGRYAAIVVHEKSLQAFAVYRPRNIKYAVRREGPLPVLIWCNGACSDSSSSYERMLNEMASHGYVVVGLGAFEMQDSERDDGTASEKKVQDAINWLVKQEKLETSDYYHAINVKNIALAGHSCGGAQAIGYCGNSRVSTLLIMNAGMGSMSMGGASPQSLDKLHTPIIYMTGGSGDVAYENAKVDYGKVKKPVVWADLADAGHNPGYWEEFGGQFPKVAIKWMDWHMKGYKQNARFFLKPDKTGISSKWTFKNRNFTAAQKNYEEPYKDIETSVDTVFDRAAMDADFDFGADVSSLTLETRQSKAFYNKAGTKQALMPILQQQGVNSIRLRVLVSPKNSNHNTSYVKTLATTANKYGMGVMLDLRYSDWLGDNTKPEAWKKYDMTKLLTVVKNHTTSVMKAIKAVANVRWVQIGNEVDNGLLLEDGRDTTNLVSIINTANDAVKAVNPDTRTLIHVCECEDIGRLTNYFDALLAAGAQFDAIGLSVHVKTSTLKPDELTDLVAQNVKTLRERYDKPVLIVETGYYNDRALEANQWLCDFMVKLMASGGAGLYYWEPELADEYDLGAWNPISRKPSLTMDAFLGARHKEPVADGINYLTKDDDDNGETIYYTPDGVRNSRPQRGVNIIRRRSGTYKVIGGK